MNGRVRGRVRTGWEGYCGRMDGWVDGRMDGRVGGWV